MMIHLITPENESLVSLATKPQKAMINLGGSHASGAQPADWLNLVKEGEDNTYPAAVTFAWEAKEPVRFFLSETNNFSDCRVITCSENTCSVENLKIGQIYYWKVEDANGNSSETFSFTTEHTAPRWIHAEGLSNIRDIGGWKIPGGFVRQGLVFRGSEMEFHHEITEHGKEVLLNQLHIKTDLDLRGEAVGKISETALGSTVNWALIPARAYNEFMSEEEKDTCRKIFKLFTNRENYPFYIHCWGGADRTGTLILMLCAILGVSEEDLLLDYELTSLSIWGARSRESDLFRALLAELNKYGEEGASIGAKCESFLLSCGITQEDLAAIRSILT